MEKYLMKGDKNDLQCENHPNSAALFLQINSQNEQQNKLLCFQCLETLNTISNLISVDALIQKMKSKHEEHFDTRKGILSLIIEQLVEIDNQVQKIFKILLDSLQEWKKQIQGIINQPIQFELKQEIFLASDQKYEKSYFDDSISQLHTHFFDSITNNLTQLNETLKLTTIREIYEKFNFNQQEMNISSFPKVVELIHEIDSKNKCISSVELNFDNTLVFFGQSSEVSSLQLKSNQSEVIIDNQYLPKISSSKNQNLIAVASKNIFSLWCRQKSLKWSNLGEFTDNDEIEKVYLNQNDTQVIIQNTHFISIVQINYDKKTLFKIQQISNFISFRMNQLNSKILIIQKDCFLIYKQQQEINQWILQEKIDLNKNETITAGIFIQNDEIIISYITGDSKGMMYYDKNQLIRVDQKNLFLQIDEKLFFFWPRLFNKQRQLYLQKNENRISFIIKQNAKFLICQHAIYLNGDNKVYIQWSTDGRIVIVGDASCFKVKIYMLTYY